MMAGSEQVRDETWVSQVKEFKQGVFSVNDIQGERFRTILA